MHNLTFVPHPNFPERAKLFFEKYENVEIVMNGDERFSTQHLQSKNERLCLFCNRDSSLTTFNNDSHLVSPFLGNIDLFSSFECDQCNNRFRQFESDLSSFIGISRTITGLYGDRKAPSFITSRLSVKSRSFVGNNVLLLSKKDLHEENDPEARRGGVTRVTYNKSTYIPSSVYKALVKAALSLLPLPEVKENYALALKFLEEALTFDGGHIYGYILPFTVKMPLHIEIYIKRDVSEKIATHVIGFYFQNYIIYLPLHLHKDDIGGLNDTVDVICAPLYFLEGNPVVNLIATPFARDLSSTDPMLDDKETMSMVINPEFYRPASKYDPDKDEFLKGEHDPATTKYIMFTRAGTVFTKAQLKEFTEFLKKEEDRLMGK